MPEKTLPFFQLIFAVLFCLLALLGPLLLSSFQAVLLSAALPGLLFGIITARIGWLAYVEKKPAVYPFRGWSIAILRLFVGGQAVQSLQTTCHSPSATRLRLTGMAGLAIGILISLVTLAAVIMALF